MNEITDNLWIADIQGAREKSTARFDLVVTVCQDSVADNIGCEYEHYELADDLPSEERWGGECSYELFSEAAETVVGALEEDKTVLVHCHVGRNRSVAVSSAALATVHGLDGFKPAFDMVRDARPIAQCTYRMADYAERFISEHQDEK